MSRDNPTGMSTQVETPGLSWSRILDEMDVIRWDVRDQFGVDLLRDTPTWHWFVDALSGLLTTPVTSYSPDGKPLWPTRLQRLVRG